MNPPKCTEYDYINFLIATPRHYSCTEAARVHPEPNNPPAHDSLNRLLYRLTPDSEQLWQESAPFVKKEQGILVIDDSTLDKPYAQQMELVTRHWSGKHKQVVSGINLITLMWTDGDTHIPCDYRLYNKQHDHLTKNDHFQSLIATADERGFRPESVVFDSWYSSLKNLKTIRKYQWHWLTRLKSNRQVNLDRQGNQPVSQLPLSNKGSIVHLKGYGLIKVFKIVSQNGNIEYWATSNLSMNELDSSTPSCLGQSKNSRGIKQLVGVERCIARKAMSYWSVTSVSPHSDICRFLTGINWFEAKGDAVRAYLVG